MKHPNKEINKAVQHAILNGWTLKPAKGHAWAILRCPNNKPDCRCGLFCQMSVWSTPRNTDNHAKQLRKTIDRCIYPAIKLHEVTQ